MGKTRTDKAKTVKGRLFRAFIALIITSEINLKLKRFANRNSMSQESLLGEMDNACASLSDLGRRLSSPLAKTRRAVMKELDLSEEDLKACVSAR